MDDPIKVAPLEGERLRWLDLLPPLIFIVLGIILVVAIFVAIARTNRGFYRANLETITLLGTLAVYLAFGAGIAVGLRRLRAPIAFLRLRWPTLGDLGWTLLLLTPWYIGIFLVSLLSAILFNGGRVIPGNSRLVFIQHPNGIGLLLLALLGTAVAAPICEEIFFRGMLFRLLQSRTNLWIAVLGSALAFGAAHASPAISLALLPIFAYMGVVLALVYVRTGWLTNTMLLHGLNNAIVTVLAFSVATR
ncbi:MAG TPA: type II CAAX endopeptidase family protein [Candidatus Acidoferrum sp.]|nr:type II CAAX endopeptidase family protein [Candidatus Acidoferrum sp.]